MEPPTRPGEFDYQPTLRGELLRLQPLRAEDFDALYQVASDPLIWEQHPYRNRYERDAFRGFFDAGLKSGGALLAIDNATDAVIGYSRFHQFDAAADEVEIGWTFLARSHWGGRYNGEMKRLMLAHAFRVVDSVVFAVGEENYRGQRALEKIGAVRDGWRKDQMDIPRPCYRIRRP